jgi:hypothetical protein
MPDILTHPAIQAAVIPFVVSIITATLFYKIRPAISVLALLVGFLATCVLITDLSLQPVTSTKKLILLTIFSALLGSILQYLVKKKTTLFISIVISSLMACTWLLWPVLSRKEWLDAIILALPLSIYCMSVIFTATFYRRTANVTTTDIRVVAIIFSVVTSVSCVIGASALYGQMAAALAAGSTGLLLVGLFFASRLGSLAGQNQQSDEFFSVLLYLPISLIAVAASVYAKLPWYALPCLAGIPAVLQITISSNHMYWKRLAIRTGLTTIPSGLALYLTWNAAGPVPF